MLIEKLSIGQRFKKYRTEKQISQIVLADGICSYSTISHLENDRNIPSAKILGKLAERLGVPLRDIMGNEESALDLQSQIEMVQVYAEMGDYSHAIQLIEKLESKRILVEAQVQTLLICRAQCLIKTGHYQSAVDLLHPFLEQQGSQQTLEDEQLCDTYNKLGTSLYRTNDFEKAYSAFEQGYKISLRFPQTNFIAARVTKNLGLTCNQLGFKEEARRYLQKAYVFFERATDMKELANTMFTLSLATGQSDYLKKARAIYEGLNMVREANIAKQHYAFHIESKHNYKQALLDLEATTIEFEKVCDFGMCVYTSSRAAIVCIDHEELESAITYLDRAHSFRNQMIEDDPYLCVDLYKAHALYFLKIREYDRCRDFSKLASELCDKMGLLSEGAVVLKIIAEAYHQEENYQAESRVLRKVVELLSRTVRGGVMT